MHKILKFMKMSQRIHHLAYKSLVRKLPCNVAPLTIKPREAYNIPTSRFIQFLRKNDNRKRLGVVSEDGTSLVELSNNSCVSNDMIKFIKQNLCIEDIQTQVCGCMAEPVTDSHTLLPPITNPGKIICVAKNYIDAVRCKNEEIPDEPLFFMKFPSALIGPRDDIIAHRMSNKIDWEIELAVIIGKEARCVPKECAMDYVFGYCIAQDISARDLQRDCGQVIIGKSLDSFCPFGPSIIHKSLIKDVNNLSMVTTVNGIHKQASNTCNMIFKIDDIIQRLTTFMTLSPGDIILTGTPNGVGMDCNPPEFLKPGDIIKSEIQCFGRLINNVIEHPDCE